MAAFVQYDITAGGINQIAKGQLGKEIQFTYITLGDGFLGPEQEVRTMTALENEIIRLDVSGVSLVGNGEVEARANFTNAALQVGFAYREIGLYAKDPDTGDNVLYCYGNANNQAEWIPPSGSTTVIEKIIKMVTIIGSATNVTAQLKSGIYITAEDLAAHNADPEAHPDLRNYMTVLDGRLGRLEDMIINDVTGNPFLIMFDTLDGLTVTGVWNKAQRRIEF